MSYSGARSVIHTHLVAAGTAVTPAIRNVRRGAAMRIGDVMIRSWYLADGDSDLIPDTLSDDTLIEQVAVAAYWPIADGTETVSQALDDQIQALKAQITTRLVGDNKLGGNVAGLTIGDFAVEYVQSVTGSWVATLNTILSLHLIDTNTIAD